MTGESNVSLTRAEWFEAGMNQWRDETFHFEPPDETDERLKRINSGTKCYFVNPLRNWFGARMNQWREKKHSIMNSLRNWYESGTNQCREEKLFYKPPSRKIRSSNERMPGGNTVLWTSFQKDSELEWTNDEKEKDNKILVICIHRAMSKLDIICTASATSSLFGFDN